MERLKSFIKSPVSKFEYRNDSKSFTRSRKLTFPILVTLILQKSVKSLSIKLNEFSDYLGRGVTASAFVQARKNLSYKFFLEANNRYVQDYYEEEVNYRKYKGLRVLAIDGSHIRMPNTEEMYEHFGKIKSESNSVVGYYSSGLCTVLYDVYNKLAINGVLSNIGDSERRHAEEEHLNYCNSSDLVILDRGYPSFQLMSSFYSQGVNFLMRCMTTGNAFKVVKKFVADSELTDQVVELKLTQPKNRDLAGKSLIIRLIKVELDSGITEVLATSLLDQKRYPREDFKDLYFLRWQVETYFDIRNLSGFHASSKL